MLSLLRLAAVLRVTALLGIHYINTWLAVASVIIAAEEIQNTVEKHSY